MENNLVKSPVKEKKEKSRLDRCSDVAFYLGTYAFLTGFIVTLIISIVDSLSLNAFSFFLFGGIILFTPVFILTFLISYIIDVAYPRNEFTNWGESLDSVWKKLKSKRYVLLAYSIFNIAIFVAGIYFFPNFIDKLL